MSMFWMKGMSSGGLNQGLGIEKSLFLPPLTRCVTVVGSLNLSLPQFSYRKTRMMVLSLSCKEAVRLQYSVFANHPETIQCNGTLELQANTGLMLHCLACCVIFCMSARWVSNAMRLAGYRFLISSSLPCPLHTPPTQVYVAMQSMKSRIGSTVLKPKTSFPHRAG